MCHRRLRLQYPLADLVSFGERRTLKSAIASADALCRFFLPLRKPSNKPIHRSKPDSNFRFRFSALLGKSTGLFLNSDELTG